MKKAAKTLKLLLAVCALAAARQGYTAENGQPGVVREAPVPDFVADEGEFPMDGFAPYSPLPRPIWYFQGGGLALKRDASGDQWFAHAVTRVWREEGDPPVPVPYDSDTILLGTQDLDFGFRGGGRVLLGRTLGDWYGFEASYFGLSSWDSTAMVSEAPLFENPQGVFSDGVLLSPWTDYRMAPVAALDDNDYISISYRSSLENFEWNFRRSFIVPPGWLQGSLLVGGRYVNIRENFDYHSLSLVGNITNDVNVRTDNQMLGVQVGALFKFQVEPQWWVDCEIKGAYFQNEADQGTVYTNANGGAPYEGTHTGGRAGTRSAFALDLRLSLIYQLGPNLSTHIGYQALWVDGLALASENFERDINILMSGPATLVDNGKVVYHGPDLGGTLSW